MGEKHFRIGKSACHAILPVGNLFIIGNGMFIRGERVWIEVRSD
jgi:hypothetical protein